MAKIKWCSFFASQCSCAYANAVLVKVSQHKKGVQTEEMKQYVAWYLEQHHQQHLGVRIVLIFDFTDAGIMNMVSTSLQKPVLNTRRVPAFVCRVGDRVLLTRSESDWATILKTKTETISNSRGPCTKVLKRTVSGLDFLYHWKGLDQPYKMVLSVFEQ